MSILTIQLLENGARKLLEDLEDLNVIKVLKEEKNIYDHQAILKLQGKLSKSGAKKLQQHVKKERSSWDKRTS